MSNQKHKVVKVDGYYRIEAPNGSLYAYKFTDKDKAMRWLDHSYRHKVPGREEYLRKLREAKRMAQ